MCTLPWEPWESWVSSWSHPPPPACSHTRLTPCTHAPAEAAPHSTPTCHHSSHSVATSTPHLVAPTLHCTLSPPHRASWTCWPVSDRRCSQWVPRCWPGRWRETHKHTPNRWFPNFCTSARWWSGWRTISPPRCSGPRSTGRWRCSWPQKGRTYRRKAQPWFKFFSGCFRGSKTKTQRKIEKKELNKSVENSTVNNDHGRYN